MDSTVGDLLQGAKEQLQLILPKGSAQITLNVRLAAGICPLPSKSSLISLYRTLKPQLAPSPTEIFPFFFHVFPPIQPTQIEKPPSAKCHDGCDQARCYLIPDLGCWGCCQSFRPCPMVPLVTPEDRTRLWREAARTAKTTNDKPKQRILPQKEKDHQKESKNDEHEAGESDSEEIGAGWRMVPSKNARIIGVMLRPPVADGRSVLFNLLVSVKKKRSRNYPAHTLTVSGSGQCCGQVSTQKTPITRQVST